MLKISAQNHLSFKLVFIQPGSGQAGEKV